MNQVFVLDTTKQPLNPVHPGYARLLLKQGKAAVYRRYPFTIRLSCRVEQPILSPLRIKVDPGSKTSGLALVNDASGDVVWAAELTHRAVLYGERGGSAKPGTESRASPIDASVGGHCRPH